MGRAGRRDQPSRNARWSTPGSTSSTPAPPTTPTKSPRPTPTTKPPLAAAEAREHAEVTPGEAEPDRADHAGTAPAASEQGDDERGGLPWWLDGEITEPEPECECVDEEAEL